jgi:hypothetical protein
LWALKKTGGVIMVILKEVKPRKMGKFETLSLIGMIFVCFLILFVVWGFLQLPRECVFILILSALQLPLVTSVLFRANKTRLSIVRLLTALIYAFAWYVLAIAFVSWKESVFSSGTTFLIFVFSLGAFIFAAKNANVVEWQRETQ